MKRFLKESVLLFLWLICGLVNSYAAEPLQENLRVPTFNKELHNWADPHTKTFYFPTETKVFEKVWLHYTLNCPESPADCDPWDRIGNLAIVTPSAAIEIARVITPYDITAEDRPGECSWLIDVTGYQSALRDSVTLRSYIETWIGENRGWQVTAVFEFVEGKPKFEPFAVQNLWLADRLIYGDPGQPVTKWIQPIDFQPDPRTDSVIVRMIITGHGQGNTENAAEFSVKQHYLDVNGTTFSHELWRDDCAKNPCSPQGGTWIYERAGWCPGSAVVPWDINITQFIQSGKTINLNYHIEPYVNQCRPNNPDCRASEDCPDCNYNYLGHTEPFYMVQTQVIQYKKLR